MKLYHIAAVSTNGVIGKQGGIRWKFSADLERFKEITSGHTVIMGRTTFGSLGEHKPLPDRRNIVLTRSSHLVNRGPVGRPCDDHMKFGPIMANNMEQALHLCKDAKRFGIGDVIDMAIDALEANNE